MYGLVPEKQNPYFTIKERRGDITQHPGCTSKVDGGRLTSLATVDNKPIKIFCIAYDSPQWLFRESQVMKDL